MRGGRPEYDLASLVYDGYARLEPEQADELLREWENISAHSIDHRISVPAPCSGLCRCWVLTPISATTRENLVSGSDSRRAGTPAEASARLHACRTAGCYASMIFPAPLMTLPPKFLLILSLFQISLGLGWILGYVLLPPTISVMNRQRNICWLGNTGLFARKG